MHLQTKINRKIDSFIKIMRWKGDFFLKQELNTNTTLKRKYGFMTKSCLPQHKELDDFGKELTNLVRNIKIHKKLNAFQKKLKRGYN